MKLLRTAILLFKVLPLGQRFMFGHSASETQIYSYGCY